MKHDIESYFKRGDLLLQRNNYIALLLGDKDKTSQFVYYNSNEKIMDIIKMEWGMEDRLKLT